MAKYGYHELIVWREAHQFVLLAYKLTKSFPREEMYGITSQLRRAAVSVPTNIVEGYARRTPKDHLRFLGIAQASLEECGYLIELSRDLGYLSNEDFDKIEDNRNRTAFLLMRSHALLFQHS